LLELWKLTILRDFYGLKIFWINKMFIVKLRRHYRIGKTAGI